MVCVLCVFYVDENGKKGNNTREEGSRSGGKYRWVIIPGKQKRGDYPYITGLHRTNYSCPTGYGEGNGTGWVPCSQ